MSQCAGGREGKKRERTRNEPVRGRKGRKEKGEDKKGARGRKGRKGMSLGHVEGMSLGHVEGMSLGGGGAGGLPEMCVLTILDKNFN